MPKQTIALAYSRPAETLGEPEYLALVQALSASARGRAFLDEHARRSRNAETNILLTAIERIEAQVRPRPRDPLYDDLGQVLDELRTARARIEAGGKMAQADQLGALLELLLRRIGKLLPAPEAKALPGEGATGSPPGNTARQKLGHAPPPHASPAPAQRPAAQRWLEDPLVPPPAVNDARPLPRPAAGKTAATIAGALRTPPRAAPQARPQVQPPARRPATAVEIEAEIKELVVTEVGSRAKQAPAPSATTVAPKTAALTAKQALAAIMALSEEERIALFS